MSEKWEAVSYRGTDYVQDSDRNTVAQIFGYESKDLAHKIVTDHNLMGEVREVLDMHFHFQMGVNPNGDRPSQSDWEWLMEKTKALLTKLQE